MPEFDLFIVFTEKHQIENLKNPDFYDFSRILKITDFEFKYFAKLKSRIERIRLDFDEILEAKVEVAPENC